MEFRKSSFCGSATCVEVAFERSSFCSDKMCVEVGFATLSASTTNGTCIEVGCGGEHHDQVLIRDSKDPDGPVLSFNREEWRAFLAGARAGEFG